jgi:hypothetical protein
VRKVYEDIIANLSFKDVDYDYEIGLKNIKVLKKDDFYTADESYFIMKDITESYC